MTHPPHLFDCLPAVETLLRYPRKGLISDIDGTLSPIAPSPELASVPEEIKQHLRVLRSGFATLAAISGRTAREAQRMLGVDGLVVLGNHGLELLEENRVTLNREAQSWAGRIGQVLTVAKEQLDLQGLRFEDKGVAAAIHYRGTPDPEAARSAILQFLARDDAARRLQILEGRKVIELRPPLRIDKGSAVRWLVDRQGLDAVIYLGDDLTDVDAFGAISQMRRDRGLAGLSIVVAGPGTPRVALREADLWARDTAEIEEFLSWLCSSLKPLGANPRIDGKATS